MQKNKNNSERYVWGDKCLGWHLVKNEDLSVIQELMPPNTQETNHYHNYAQQFFFILKGIATFITETSEVEISAGNGFHVEPGTEHQIFNHQEEGLEFLVISQPTSRGDKIDIPIPNED